MLNLELLLGTSFLSKLEKLFLRENRVLDINDTVLRLLGMGQDTDYSIANASESGGAKLDIAFIPKGNLRLGEVEEEVVLDAPVKEGTVIYKCVADLALLCKLNKFILNGNLCTKDRKFPHAGDNKV
ncbi:hypothetical protein HG531_013742 [Fusarium graminearum]|nr:hypothetical protein HG531_013742 [Fusarium graminearum]